MSWKWWYKLPGEEYLERYIELNENDRIELLKIGRDKYMGCYDYTGCNTWSAKDYIEKTHKFLVSRGLPKDAEY